MPLDLQQYQLYTDDKLWKVCSLGAGIAAWVYPRFSSIKRLGVFLLPPGWRYQSVAGHSPAICYVSPTIHRYPFILLGGERHCECLTQENNTMSPARARTQTSSSSRDERTNHAPPSHRMGGWVVLYSFLLDAKGHEFREVTCLNCLKILLYFVWLYA